MTSESAPALFLEPPSREFGVRWFGQRGFGGILENETSGWIPQYNLQNYWKRQIAPFAVGLIEPLVPPRFRKPDNFSRLPGQFSYKINEYELYNRNLLAARFQPGSSEEENDILNVWTVNERSKRQYLEGFQVEINKKGQPVVETMTSTLDRKLKMVPPIKSEDISYSFRNRHKEPLLELRTSVWSSENSTNLYLRSPTLLQMLEVSDKHTQQVPVFHSAVKCFAESPLIIGRLAVVDFGGRVWMLQLNEDVGNAKLVGNPDEMYQNAVFTDHPMTLALSGHFHVELADSRSCDGIQKLWKTRAFATREHKEPLYFQETAPAPPIIRHVAKVPSSANNYVVMTDYSMVLLDDRFPGKSVLEVRHPFSSGGHRIIMTENPIKDTIEGGEIFPILSLEQLPLISSAVSMTKLYRHSSGLWSAVDAFHSLGEPHNFNQSVRRGKYVEGAKIIEEPTRAMCLVELSTESSLLLRQTDDGAIWWQNLKYSSLTEKKLVKEERKSAKRIEDRMRMEEDWSREEWRPVYSDGMSEEVKESQVERRSIVHIEISEIDRKIISKCARRAHNAHRKVTLLQGEEKRCWKKLEVLELDDENSTLSKIALDTWRDSEAKMEEHE